MSTNPRPGYSFRKRLPLAAPLLLLVVASLAAGRPTKPWPALHLTSEVVYSAAMAGLFLALILPVSRKPQSLLWLPFFALGAFAGIYVAFVAKDSIERVMGVWLASANVGVACLALYDRNKRSVKGD